MSDCILWTGSVDKDGYGRNKMRLAHRVAYEDAGGTLIEGMEIDHLCRVRACINPEHLEQVTREENNRRSNSASAKNARKTHCKNGHEFTPENIYQTMEGVRQCRACTNARQRNYQLRKKLGIKKPKKEATPKTFKENVISIMEMFYEKDFIHPGAVKFIVEAHKQAIKELGGTE